MPGGGLFNILSHMNVFALQKGIIYGPVASRRLGRSLGLNVSGAAAKVCSFDCVYCHYGRGEGCAAAGAREGFPDPDEVAAALAAALASLEEPPAFITFSGNGEPTLHPAFGEVVAAVRAVRDGSAPAARLAILSNSSTAGIAGVRAALAGLDVRIMKLDAGTPELFQRVNAPRPGVTLEAVLDGLTVLSDVTLQTCLVAGEPTNADDIAIGTYVAAVKRLAPARVQLYTTDRPVGTAGIRKVAADRIAEIARRVREDAGVTVEVF